MSYRLSILFLCCLSFFSLSVNAQGQLIEDKPRFDPFKKPDQFVKASTKAPVVAKSVFTTKLQLIATLRAGKNSMVNVQGRIVRLGEEIDGYTLLEVNDHSAVFANSEQQVHLSLDTK